MSLATVVLVVAALLAAACSVGERAVNVSDYTGTSESEQIGLHVDACGADLSFDVDERADEVIVGVSARNERGGDCQGVLAIELSSPLGDRVIVDARDNEPVRAFPAFEPSERLDWLMVAPATDIGAKGEWTGDLIIDAESRCVAATLRGDGAPVPLVFADGAELRIRKGSDPFITLGDGRTLYSGESVKLGGGLVDATLSPPAPALRGVAIPTECPGSVEAPTAVFLISPWNSAIEINP